MTAPVNGTDERLDVLIVLFEQLLAELRQGNALQGAGELAAAKKPPAAAKKSK